MIARAMRLVRVRRRMDGVERDATHQQAQRNGQIGGNRLKHTALPRVDRGAGTCSSSGRRQCWCVCRARACSRAKAPRLDAHQSSQRQTARLQTSRHVARGRHRAMVGLSAVSFPPAATKPCSSAPNCGLAGSMSGDGCAATRAASATAAIDLATRILRQARQLSLRRCGTQLGGGFAGFRCAALPAAFPAATADTADVNAMMALQQSPIRITR